MSTIASPTAHPAAAAAPGPPWARLAPYLLRVAGVFTLGVLALLALAWVVAVALSAGLGSTTPVQILRYLSVSSVSWVAFAALIGCVGVQVRPVVHAGFTRRALTIAGIVTALLVGATFATGSVALASAGVAVGEQIAGEPIFLGTAPWWSLLAAVGMQCVTAAASGLLVGASFIRWSGWATLLLPVTAGLPFFAQDALTGSVSLRGTVPGDGVRWAEQLQALPSAAAASLSVSVLALTLLGAWLVLRDLPLRPRTG